MCSSACFGWHSLYRFQRFRGLEISSPRFALGSGFDQRRVEDKEKLIKEIYTKYLLTNKRIILEVIILRLNFFFKSNYIV